VASEAAVGAAKKADRLVMRTAGIAVTLVLCIWSPAVLAQREFDRVSQSIRNLIDEQRLPSVVVAVAKNGRIVWEEGFGWADVERQVPATPHTPYSLASVSKPFTATAVMKLVDEQRLFLDRSANDYLGDAKITGRDPAKATVRRILSHTAGLPPYFRMFAESDPPPIEEIITRYAVLTNPPGRRHVYSNLGYGVLEHIISRISGRSYDEFMRREVFLPLALAHASVPRAAPAEAAVRYDALGRPMPFYDLGHRGASAIYASAHDLVRFGMFHLKERLDDGTPILKRGSIDAMQRIETPESPTDGYGLGWRISEDAGFRHVSHTGGMPGVTTVLSLFPTERLVVVVLTNTRNAAVVRLAQELAALADPQYGWRLRQARRSDRE
jgi:CubicO group peptidase (beta-lactamase class C family)